jgi:hypothetical protein
LVRVIVGKDLPLVGSIEDNRVARTGDGSDVGRDPTIIVASIRGIGVEIVERRKGEDSEQSNKDNTEYGIRNT